MHHRVRESFDDAEFIYVMPKAELAACKIPYTSWKTVVGPNRTERSVVDLDCLGDFHDDPFRLQPATVRSCSVSGSNDETAHFGGC